MNHWTSIHLLHTSFKYLIIFTVVYVKDVFLFFMHGLSFGFILFWVGE